MKVRERGPYPLGQAGVYDANDMKVEYQYDYMSRRVERKVWICTAGGANPTWQAAGYGWERFVYDEWNVVMVLNGSDNTAVKKYTWGLDLSGTLHGAGGIGGLLASDENGSGSGCTGKFWFFYDANGNVGQIFKYVPSPESVTLAAYYEYDPYGGILDSGGSGAYPSQNPVRFSTKWFDVDFETGLGYWGYRYYSPRLGRWMSRDPIGERGGANLYSYVHGDPVGRLDPDGRSPLACPATAEAFTCRFDCKGWVQRETGKNAWLKGLPNCPCTLAAATADTKTWYPPIPANPTYHPGGGKCVRSKPATDGGPGQQCCYDSSGALITDGAAAGTPDKVSPDGLWDACRHYFVDVMPFEQCPLEDYLQGRPPNNGNGCAANKKP